MMGIYKITNPKGKVYIGQSSNIEKRFKLYNCLNCKQQTRLYNSFIKYGVQEHIFEVLSECIFEELNEKERYYQDLFDCTGRKGLNCVLTNTKELKAVLSKETREKMSRNSGRYNLGRSPSPETRRKISLSLTGKKASKETIEKREATFKERRIRYGRKLSLETKRLIGLANKNPSPEKRRKISETKSTILFDPTSGVYYSSIKELALLLNIGESTLRYQLDNNKLRYLKTKNSCE